MSKCTDLKPRSLESTGEAESFSTFSPDTHAMALLLRLKRENFLGD
jgi:hypothetical protein